MSTATTHFQLSATTEPGVMAVEARSAHHFGRHTHDEFGLGVMLSGAQQSASGRGGVRAQAGDVISVNPGEVHDGTPIDQRERHWRMLYIHPSAMARALALVDKPPGSELHHPVLRHTAARQALLGLHALWTQPQPAPDAWHSDSLWVTLLSPLLAPSRTQAQRPHALARVRQRIDDCPEADWPLQHMAQEAGLSVFHFIRAFRQATGLPPHAYRLQKRLQQARRLIAQHLPLAEVAAACGFADQSHLHRLFVRSYGYRPGVFALAQHHTQRPA